METERRRILQAVREGSVAPEDALRLLEELGEDRSEGPADRREEPDAHPDLRLLRVVQEVGTVVVRGDPTVAQFRASGPHSVREEGRTVVIKGDASWVGIGFVMGPHERRPRWRWPGKEHRTHSFLELDVNPSMPLDLKVEAGRLEVVDMRAPITARVELGTMVVKNFDAPVDLKVESGTVNVTGVFSGRSCIACELGKVIARIDSGSDVRVNAHCTLGSVSLGNTHEPKRKRSGVGSAGEFKVGNGSGDLDIRVEAGSIKVEVGR